MSSTSACVTIKQKDLEILLQHCKSCSAFHSKASRSDELVLDTLYNSTGTQHDLPSSGAKRKASQSLPKLRKRKVVKVVPQNAHLTAPLVPTSISVYPSSIQSSQLQTSIQLSPPSSPLSPPSPSQYSETSSLSSQVPLDFSVSLPPAYAGLKLVQTTALVTQLSPHSLESRARLTDKSIALNWFLTNIPQASQWRDAQKRLCLHKSSLYVAAIRTFIGDPLDTAIPKESVSILQGPSCTLVELGMKFAKFVDESLGATQLMVSCARFRVVVLASYCILLEKSGTSKDDVDEIMRQGIGTKYNSYHGRRQLLKGAAWINSIVVALVQQHGWTVYRATELFFLDAMSLKYVQSIGGKGNYESVLSNLRKHEFSNGTSTNALAPQYTIPGLIASFLGANRMHYATKQINEALGYTANMLSNTIETVFDVKAPAEDTEDRILTDFTFEYHGPECIGESEQIFVPEVPSSLSHTSHDGSGFDGNLTHQNNDNHNITMSDFESIVVYDQVSERNRSLSHSVVDSQHNREDVRFARNKLSIASLTHDNNAVAEMSQNEHPTSGLSDNHRYASVQDASSSSEVFKLNDNIVRTLLLTKLDALKDGICFISWLKPDVSPIIMMKWDCAIHNEVIKLGSVFVPSHNPDQARGPADFSKINVENMIRFIQEGGIGDILWRLNAGYGWITMYVKSSKVMEELRSSCFQVTE